MAVISDHSLVHLYHLKHGFWSQLSVNAGDIGSVYNPTHLFTVYGGDLILVEVSTNSICTYKLVITAGRWVKSNHCVLPRSKSDTPYTFRIGQTPPAPNPHILVTASLFEAESLILLEPLCSHGHQSSSLTSLRYFSDSQWSQPKALKMYIECKQSSGHYSFGTVHDYMYVSNGANIYQLHISAEAIGGQQIEVTSIPSTPLSAFTIACIENTLFSFGGRDTDDQPSSDVFRYNPDSKEWESIGYMRSARYHAIVTPVKQDQGTN